MELSKIKDFIYAMQKRDIQDFENDLIQLWDFMKRNTQVNIACKVLESEYREIDDRIKNFYLRLNESFNKKEYIEQTKSLLSEKNNSIVAFGFFLYREELKFNVIGYHRIMMYWFAENGHETVFDSKKAFMNKILLPLSEYFEKNVTTNLY